MILSRRTGGRSRWRRGRIHVLDGEEVGSFAEGEERSFDDGTGD